MAAMSSPTRAMLIQYSRWHGPPIASALPPPPLIQTVQVWDAADGSNAFTYKGHAHSVLLGGMVPEWQAHCLRL